jgi:polar amino acid transport system substrate-binding protein
MKWPILILFNLIILNQVHSADSFTFWVDSWPPFNFRVSGAVEGKQEDPVEGISVEIFKELMKRSGLVYKLKIDLWEKTYSMALNQKGNAVFSMTRTKGRENKFKWVGPLVANDWVLVGKKGLAYRINQLDEAKSYKIGALKNDAIAIYLAKKGFSNLEYSNIGVKNALKLKEGKIDLWAEGSVTAPFWAKAIGMKDFKTAYTVKRNTFIYIGFHKSTDEKLISRLNLILRKMRREGFFKKVYSKYR